MSDTKPVDATSDYKEPATVPEPKPETQPPSFSSNPINDDDDDDEDDLDDWKPRGPPKTTVAGGKVSAIRR
ncbi:hypothetical protein FOMPIDRAFT_1024054 [Fomitopsis schrenkii]|uniref:Uncharacterized protein n=1 Tax=Fomitopsis schrenkii TaxID=2126942 RepID=S8E4V9_FOMSC|nr:hypothetical protein FOMPIDRAFT_1024054 [Fomitopsis schrenkii]